MELTKEEAEKIIEWGIMLFEMGYDAAYHTIRETHHLSKDLKIEAIRKYIQEVKP